MKSGSCVKEVVVEDIKHTITIKAAPGKVYQAITTQEGLAGWWTECTAKPELGFVNVFKFNGQGVTKMKVITLVADKTVEWKCVDGWEEWIGTEISFNLAEKDNATTVHFAHKGWKEKNDDYVLCYKDWGLFMKSLKALCETGKGMPFNKETVSRYGYASL